MKPHPIQNEEDLAQVKTRLFELMTQIIDGNASTDDINERAVWAILIDEYTQRITPTSIPIETPKQLIEKEMARFELNQNDFAQHINVYQSHISDILRGKRGLSKSVARALLQNGAHHADVLNALLYTEK